MAQQFYKHERQSGEGDEGFISILGVIKIYGWSS